GDRSMLGSPAAREGSALADGHQDGRARYQVTFVDVIHTEEGARDNVAGLALENDVVAVRRNGRVLAKVVGPIGAAAAIADELGLAGHHVTDKDLLVKTRIAAHQVQRRALERHIAAVAA